MHAGPFCWASDSSLFSALTGDVGESFSKGGFVSAHFGVSIPSLPEGASSLAIDVDFSCSTGEIPTRRPIVLSDSRCHPRLLRHGKNTPTHPGWPALPGHPSNIPSRLLLHLPREASHPAKEHNELVLGALAYPTGGFAPPQKSTGSVRNLSCPIRRILCIHRLKSPHFPTQR